MTNHMAIDQHGETFHGLGPHPRKALLARVGRKSARKMYCDKISGGSVHVGWIIGQHWFTVYEVKPMERKA